MPKMPFILFFIANGVPTREEELAAEALSPMRTVYRNSRYVTDTAALEHCDGVAGIVSEQYAAAYPTAEEAKAQFDAQRDADYAAKEARAAALQHDAAARVSSEAGDAETKAEADKLAADKLATKAKSDKDAADADKKAKAAQAAKTAAEAKAATWTDNA